MYSILYVVFQFEESAKEVADEVTKPRPEGEEEVQDIQVMLKSGAHSCSLRDIKVGNKSYISILFSV